MSGPGLRPRPARRGRAGPERQETVTLPDVAHVAAPQLAVVTVIEEAAPARRAGEQRESAEF